MAGLEILKVLIKYHPSSKESRYSSQKNSGREHGANFITSYQIHILDTIKFHAFAKLVIEFLEVILIVFH